MTSPRARSDGEAAAPPLETPAWSAVAQLGSLVSEVPTWSARDQGLYWADCYAPALRRTDLATGETQGFPLPERLGSFAFRDGGALVALESGLFDLRFDTGALTKRFDAPYGAGDLHFNDGRADPAGRFIVGSSQDPDLQPTGRGAFYRVDANGIAPIVDGITSANGVAFSPDGRTLYLGESREFVIYAYDYDPATGSASRRRVFARTQTGQHPDGAAVDTTGGYWVALMGAGKIARFTPEGQLDRLIRAPTRFPTMVAFGGDERRTMFLTSSRKYVEALAPAARENERPVAGGVFRWRSDVQGLPEPELAF